MDFVHLFQKKSKQAVTQMGAREAEYYPICSRFPISPDLKFYPNFMINSSEWKCWTQVDRKILLGSKHALLS